MNKCKNCGTEIEDRLIYCSYKCRNIFVNKNIRDYTKYKETINLKNKEKENIYYLNPKTCVECENIIIYEKRRNLCCCRSCSVSYTNKNRKGKYKYRLSDKGRESLIKSAEKNLINRVNRNFNSEEYLKYEESPNRCTKCNIELPYKRRKNKFCCMECKNQYHIDNRTDIKNYKIQCKFNFSLNDYPDEFDFLLIEKYGWYKAKNHGDNLNGVSRDHMYSIMQGFRNNIDPYLISHPANCKLLLHNDNASKSDNCSITIDELKKRINEWNNKY